MQSPEFQKEANMNIKQGISFTMIFDKIKRSTSFVKEGINFQFYNSLMSRPELIKELQIESRFKEDCQYVIFR